MQPLFTFRDSIKVVSVEVALRGRRVSPDADPNQTPLPIDIREELEDLQIRPGLNPQERPIVAVIRPPGGDVLRENPVAHIARAGISTLISYRIACVHRHAGQEVDRRRGAVAKDSGEEEQDVR